MEWEKVPDALTEEIRRFISEILKNMEEIQWTNKIYWDFHRFTPEYNGNFSHSNVLKCVIYLNRKISTYFSEGILFAIEIKRMKNGTLKLKSIYEVQEIKRINYEYVKKTLDK